MATTLPDVSLVEAIAELTAVMREVRDELRRNRQAPERRAVSRSDRDTLDRLLPVVGGLFGSEPFTTRDLFEHDSAGLRVVLKGVRPSVIGQTFRRSEGQPIAGYVVKRDRSEFGVTVWRLFRVHGDEQGRVPRPPLHESAPDAIVSSKEFSTT